MSAGEEDLEEVELSQDEIGSSQIAQSGGKALHHQRISPLPYRVRDGRFSEEYLDAGGEHIPWSEIAFVSLGVIDLMIKDSELKKGPLRKMVQKVTGGGEEGGSDKGRAKQTREVYILDIYTTRQDQPFRFEAGSVNYKSFLDKVGYVSHHNFFRFVVHLCRHLPHATTTNSLAAFLAKRREKVSHYSDYYDYELEVEQQMRLSRDIQPMSEIDLSNDSWIDEWD